MKYTIGVFLSAGITLGLAGCASKPEALDAGHGAVAPADSGSASGADPSGKVSSNVVIASATPIVPAEGTAAVKAVPWTDLTVATVNNRKPVSISMSELIKPLIEAHGLDMLLNIVQRDLAKQGTDEAGIVVTAEDFKAERERTLALLFQDLDAKIQDEIDKAQKAKKPEDVKRWQDEKEVEHQQLLKQFYDQKHLTATDFDVVIQTNTYLRKIAERNIDGKITEEMLKAEFAARFGEKVRVRHIELKRPQDAGEVKRKLAAGEKFENVARELSSNRETAALGGELLPFTREAPFLPKVFKDVAFDLKVGQVSDLVNAGDSYQIIKLEERIMPKAVVFEQQRDILFRDVHEQMVQGVVTQLRRTIAVATRDSLKISDPVMNKQFQDRLDAMNATAKGKEAAEEEMARERDRLRLEEQLRVEQQAATQRSTTQPAGSGPVPTAPAATQRAIVPPPRVVRTPAATAPAAPPPAAPVPAAPAPRSGPLAPATAPAARAAAARLTSATRPG